MTALLWASRHWFTNFSDPDRVQGIEWFQITPGRLWVSLFWRQHRTFKQVGTADSEMSAEILQSVLAPRNISQKLRLVFLHEE